MKDEEMAEEYICNGKCQDDITRNYVHCKTCTRIKDFLAGLKAQWHDLRENPNDLPKEDKYYLIVTKLNNYYISKFRGTCWIGKCNAYVSEDMVIAWCEIPTFDKE